MKRFVRTMGSNQPRMSQKGILITPLITLMAIAALLLSCSNESITPPDQGGKITHLTDNKYSIIVRYRTGGLAAIEATLEDDFDMPLNIGSLEKLLTFSTKDCGHLYFLQPGHGLQSFMRPDSAPLISPKKDCPIYFGAVENIWHIDL